MHKLPPASRHAQQFFCGDFLHHLDLKITFGDQLLQPGILRLELLQAPDLVPCGTILSTVQLRMRLIIN
jgi:hypothetical protein